MKGSVLQKYLKDTSSPNLDPGFIGYVAALDGIKQVSPETAASIVKELEDQRSYLKLIASENYSSLACQMAMGNLLTDKYSEGFPFHRFYAGCDNVDDIESYTVEQAKKLFGAEHAYVQPHSGADANLIAYWAILTTRVQNPLLEKMGEANPAKLSRERWNEIRAACGNQRILGLDYYSGGHLTHGYRFNVSAQMFDAYSYSVSKETGILDYDELEKQVKEIKPLILLAGYSAYPRLIDCERMRQIADSVGAVFMMDMAHFSGLVAGKVMSGKYDPIKYADVVTTTTHKTLRGPRGGMVLCKAEFADAVDKGCPLVIGGPLPHVMAAKAVAFTEANSKEYQEYAAKIVENSKALADACQNEGMTVATGGTDNHLLLLDVTSFGLNGRQAENVLRECGITLNRNALPFDPNGPWYTSGLRIGTPAITTLGMGIEDMKEIAAIIKSVLSVSASSTITSGKKTGQKSKSNYDIDPAKVKTAKERVNNLIKRYPVYPEIDLEFLKTNFM